MTNPGQRHLSVFKLGELRFAAFARPFREQCFPDHLVEKTARIEVIAWSQLSERARNAAPAPGWWFRLQMTH